MTIPKNKKIRNATKTTVDGIKFDSQLEAYMYGLLKRHKIEFRMKDKFVVQQPFEYNGEKVREIAMKPDFIIPLKKGIIVLETKGFPNDSYPLKLKLLKRYLNSKYCVSHMVIAKNKAECEEAITFILGLTNPL